MARTKAPAKTVPKTKQPAEKREQPPQLRLAAGVERKPRTTKSKKAGLMFPVTVVHRAMKRGHYASTVRVGSAVYMAAILEYLTAEILELAGNAAAESKRRRIIPRHLMLAIRNDDEMDQMLKGVTIAEGGVIPYLHPSLAPKKSGKEHNAAGDSAMD